MIDTVQFQEAIHLFNEGKFFECHEVLEDLWKPLPMGPEKTFLQGLLQVGVGFHHWQNGNLIGAKNLLEAGIDKLIDVSKTPDYQPPVALKPLLKSVLSLQSRLLQTGIDEIPNFPRIAAYKNAP